MPVSITAARCVAWRAIVSDSYPCDSKKHIFPAYSMVTISITAARCVAWRCVARDIETPMVFLFFVYYSSDSDSAEKSKR